MRISEYRAGDHAGFGTIARFDCEVSPDIKLLRMILHRNRRGELTVYPAKASGSQGGVASAFIAPTLLTQIRELAINHMKRQSPLDHTFAN